MTTSPESTLSQPIEPCWHVRGCSLDCPTAAFRHTTDDVVSLALVLTVRDPRTGAHEVLTLTHVPERDRPIDAILLTKEIREQLYRDR